MFFGPAANRQPFPIPVSFRLCNSNPVALSLPPPPRRHRNSCRFDANLQKAQAARPDKSGMVCCSLRQQATTHGCSCRSCWFQHLSGLHDRRSCTRLALPSATASYDIALLRQTITSGDLRNLRMRVEELPIIAPHRVSILILPAPRQARVLNSGRSDGGTAC